MATTASQPPAQAGIWTTFTESPVAVKAIFAGVFVNRVGGFLTIFLVLYLISEGHSPSEAAVGLGSYGLGGVIGVLIGGMLADRLGARNATVLSMSSSAVLVASLLYLPNYMALLAAVTLCGLVSQIFRPASATLLSELTPESRQVMIFAMYRFGLNVGATAATCCSWSPRCSTPRCTCSTCRPCRWTSRPRGWRSSGTPPRSR
jgi:MFS family permease